MRFLFTALLLGAVGVLGYSVIQLSRQNDSLSAQVRDQATRIEGLQKDLAKARTTDQAQRQVIDGDLDKTKTDLERERGALQAAKSRLDQVRDSGISEEEIERAAENVRLQKDLVDGVSAQLKLNRNKQADLGAQKKAGLDLGNSGKAEQDAEINAQIAASQQKIKTLQSQIAEIRARRVDPMKAIEIKPLQDQITAENENLTALRSRKQNDGATFNAERTAFVSDADSKVRALKAEEDQLRTRQASENAILQQYQKTLADLRTNRGNKAAAIKQAEQDLAEHQRRVQSLEQLLEDQKRAASAAQ